MEDHRLDDRRAKGIILLWWNADYSGVWLTITSVWLLVRGVFLVGFSCPQRTWFDHHTFDHVSISTVLTKLCLSRLWRVKLLLLSPGVQCVFIHFLCKKHLITCALLPNWNTIKENHQKQHFNHIKCLHVTQNNNIPTIKVLLLKF